MTTGSILRGVCGKAMAEAAAAAQSAGGGIAHIYSLPPAQEALARHLAHIRLALHFGLEMGVLLALWLLLESGLARWLAQIAMRMSKRAWMQTAWFALGVLLVFNLMVFLPMNAMGHGASLQAGISIQGWLSWLRDEAVATLLMVAVAVPILVFGLWLLMRSPRRAWLWFWLASIPVILLGALILPEVVEPLFDHFEPLTATHPELVVQFERVVARTGTRIPPQRMYLMQASAKGNGLNAYVSGIGPTKRIVVWDTTADRMPKDEILFILAHESGHYVLHHLAWGIGMGIAGTLLLLWLMMVLSEWLLRILGPRWRIGSITELQGLVVLLLALAMLETLSEPVGNTISRAIEHQADVYGQEAIHGIVLDPQRSAVAAFQQLGLAWLEDPEPNPLVVFWTYDHPSIQSRAEFAARYNPWMPGKSPRYFPASPETHSGK